ncbi:MAG: sulfatase-like hydrolase/transferase [Lentisphaeraceae bacterium]|nr:sulfatase-like hydrolase/transferase [Lentisphaeraceae bacterium]
MVADHYNNIRGTGVEVQRILEQLKKDGQLENTIVFFLSDHGLPDGPRHKQFCYEGGIRVPLIIRIPKNFPFAVSDSVRNDLVSGIDLAPTSLAFAGITIPEWMEGQDIFEVAYKAKKYVVSARDRCDFSMDRIRALVSKRYKYIRNFNTKVAYMQDSYRSTHEPFALLKEMYKKGQLNEIQARFASNHRPAEEFYDLQNDPHELNNLAQNDKYKDLIIEHRDLLQSWIKKSGDVAQYPESPQSLIHVIHRWGDRCKGEGYKKGWELYRELKDRSLKGK